MMSYLGLGWSTCNRFRTRYQRYLQRSVCTDCVSARKRHIPNVRFTAVQIANDRECEGLRMLRQEKVQGGRMMM